MKLTAFFFLILSLSSLYSQESDTAMASKNNSMNVDFNHSHLNFELSLPTPNLVFRDNNQPLYPPNPQSLIGSYVPRISAGIFPTKRLEAGVSFYPAFIFSDIRFENFSYLLGVYTRYYFLFKHKKREIKWFSIAPTFRYCYGNYANSLSLAEISEPYQPPYHHRISLGWRVLFRLPKHFAIHLDSDYFLKISPLGTAFTLDFYFGLNYNVTWRKKK